MALTRLPVRPVVLVEDDNEDFIPLDSNPAPNYTYQPLQSKGDHIRLIKLSPGEFSDRIKIDIKIVEFDRFDTPPYYALSYTWNDSHHDRLVISGKRILMDDPLRLEYDIRHPIWCGEQRLLISTNLRDALRRLRHATQPQTFWIDALCINQEDLDERASQVLIMQRIYHKSTMVKLWLGETSDHSNEGFEVLRQLAEIAKERLVDQSVEDLYDKEYLESQRLPSFPSPAWAAALDLLDRPVFYRIWIVQELVAAVAALAHCGPCTPISFEMLSSAVNLLKTTGWLQEMYKKFKPEEAYFLSITAISYIRSKWLREQTLELRHERRRDLVSVTRRFLASDPSDKVFALISLINDYGHRSLHGEDCPDGMLRDRHKSRILPGIQRIIDEHQDLVAASILQKATDPALVAIGKTLVSYLDFALDVLPTFQAPTPDANLGQRHQDLMETWREVHRGISRFKMQERTLDDDNHIVQQFLDRLHPKIISRIEIFYGLLEKVPAASLMEFADDTEYHDDIQQLEDLIIETRRLLTDPSAIPANLSRDFGIVGPVVSSNELLNDDSDSSVGGTVHQPGEGGAPISFTIPMDDEGNVDVEQLNRQLELFTVRNDDVDEQRDWAWTPKGLRVPNYHLAVEDVYTEFTVKCMLDDRNLEMLLGIEDRSERVHTNLPSWVPDLSVAPSGASLKRWYDRPGENKYRASTSEPANIHWDPAVPRLLVVDGYEFDVVESLADKKTVGGTLRENRAEWDALIAHLPETYPSIYGDDDKDEPDNQQEDRVSLHEAFWRTAIGDGVHTPNGFITPAPEEYGRYYEVLNVMTDYAAEVPDLDERMRNRFKNGLVTADDLRRCAEIQRMIIPLVFEVAIPRRLCVTKGGFLGVVPPAAQEGDLVYLLNGGAVPFVLRPVAGKEGEFEIIGECFVYGIMNGEAIWKNDFEWKTVMIS